MKVITVHQFKLQVSKVLQQVMNGEEIGLAMEETGDVIATIVPAPEPLKRKRQIGLLDGKGSVVFGKDYEITEEEFLGY